MTLLQTAAWNGHENVVPLHQKRGAAIEAEDREGWTSLHHASWNGHANTVGLLLQNAANPNSKSQEGNTPLYHAAWNGHLEVVKLLLQGKANVNEICADGETALQQAAWRGHNTVAAMLIEAGADLNIRSNSGRTALHEAATNGLQTMVELLLNAGADQTLMTEDGQTASEAATEHSYHNISSLLENQGSCTIGEEGQAKQNPSEINNRRTGLDVDPAIAEMLGLDSTLCTMDDHGDTCSSESFKIISTVDGKTTIYFTKIGKDGEMFEGEHASLTALKNAVPSLCPLSIGHGKLVNSDGYFLVTEFLDTRARSSDPNSGLSFAQKLARLHSQPVPIPDCSSTPMFGFFTTTHAGRARQDNTFCRSWAKFYAENRLHVILRLVEESHGTDEELRELIEKTTSIVVPKLLGDGHLGGSNGIKPSLVHGDLWSGNKARGRLGGKGGIEDYAFDASSCYAHSEYELGLMRMFGGFSAGFFSEYHRLLPKTEPVHEYEDRMALYQIYHWLVNWLLFRGGYRGDAMKCMQGLLLKHDLT